MRRIIFSLFTVSFISAPIIVSAAEHHVPGDYSTIQAAVNASVDGDMVIVEIGTHHENVTVEKSIILTSSDPKDSNIVANTIIDAGGSGSAVTFSSELVTINAQLRGFTVTGANSGGIDCAASNVTISNCVISNNQASSGSGKGGQYNSRKLRIHR